MHYAIFGYDAKRAETDEDGEPAGAWQLSNPQAIEGWAWIGGIHEDTGAHAQLLAYLDDCGLEIREDAATIEPPGRYTDGPYLCMMPDGGACGVAVCWRHDEDL